MIKKSKILLFNILGSLLIAGCDAKTSSCISHIDANDDGLCDICNVEFQKHKFEGVTFSSKEVAYDGNEHSLVVENVPEFATVTYKNNNKVNVGNYVVTATIKALNYETLTLNATLKIKGMSFTGVVFNSQEIPYDGDYHSIYATNVPEFATVTYQGNNKVNIGTHQVKATISATNYETLILYANMIIRGNVFTGITFKDQEFIWDDNIHSLAVEGAPDFATVTYSSNNRQWNPGRYEITATISAEGYETLVLKAIMSIVKRLPYADLEDRTLIYNGRDQLIYFDIPQGNLTNGAYNSIKEELKVDGKIVSSRNDFRVKTVGEHKVSIKLTSTYNYDPSYIEATITVLPLSDVGGENKSKDSFKFAKDLKYKELKSLIMESNFTLEVQIADEYFYPDSRTELKYDSLETLFFNDGEMFSYIDTKITRDYGSYFSESYMKHAKIIDDEAFIASYDDGSMVDYETKKIPASAYEENVLAAYGLDAIKLLREGVNGEIVAGTQGGYNTTYSSFEINEELNCITIETRNHYYRSEFDHDEIAYYTIYNVGNTELHVPEILGINKESPDTFGELSSYYSVNGFTYSQGIVDVTFNSCDLTYVEKGEYIIPLMWGGEVIKTVAEDYYHKYYNLDLSGYTFKVYFASNGYYEGEYEEYGYVQGYRALDNLFYDGATILYYGEW